MEPISHTQLLTQLQSLAKQAGINPTSTTTGTAATSEFSQLLKQSIQGVNKQMKTAGALAKSFEMEDPNVNIAQVMIERQKSRVSFAALMQVRNKLMNSYQEIMRMSI